MTPGGRGCRLARTHQRPPDEKENLLYSENKNFKINWRSWCSGDNVHIRSARKQQQKVPFSRTSGLKVIGLSEPKLAQSLSRGSSADARLPPLPAVLRDQPSVRASAKQQSKEGDKHTNHCDLLLIVYHSVKKRRKKNKNWTKSTANWIVFVWTGFALKKKKQINKNFCDRGHIWQWHNNLVRPVWEPDKPSQRGRIDTNYSFLKLSPHWSRDKCQRGRGTLALMQ